MLLIIYSKNTLLDNTTRIVFYFKYIYINDYYYLYSNKGIR